MADTARLSAGRTLRAFLVVSSMEDDIVKRLREQERILGEMRDNVLGWMDDLLRDAFNPESFPALCRRHGDRPFAGPEPGRTA